MLAYMFSNCILIPRINEIFNKKRSILNNYEANESLVSVTECSKEDTKIIPRICGVDLRHAKDSFALFVVSPFEENSLKHCQWFNDVTTSPPRKV